MSLIPFAHCLSIAIYSLFALGAAVALAAIITITREALPAIRQLLEEMN